MNIKVILFGQIIVCQLWKWPWVGQAQSQRDIKAGSIIMSNIPSIAVTYLTHTYTHAHVRSYSHTLYMLPCAWHNPQSQEGFGEPTCLTSQHSELLSWDSGPGLADWKVQIFPLLRALSPDIMKRELWSHLRNRLPQILPSLRSNGKWKLGPGVSESKIKTQKCWAAT